MDHPGLDRSSMRNTTQRLFSILYMGSTGRLYVMMGSEDITLGGIGRSVFWF